MSAEHSEGTDNAKSGSRLRMRTSSLLLSCFGSFQTSPHLLFQQLAHQPRQTFRLLDCPLQHFWHKLHRRRLVAFRNRAISFLSRCWCFHGVIIQHSCDSCTLFACSVEPYLYNHYHVIFI